MNKTLNSTATHTLYVVRRTDKTGGGAILALRRTNVRSKQKYFWSKKNQKMVPPVLFENKEVANRIAYRYGGTVCVFNEND